jgi:hypothetical protein
LRCKLQLVAQISIRPVDPILNGCGGVLHVASRRDLKLNVSLVLRIARY